MIKITIRLDENGVLSVVRAAGHSEAAAKGHDIVCASASILLRTLGKLLEKSEGVDIEGSADSRGEFYLDVVSIGETAGEWMKGVTSFFISGFIDLENDYPENLSVSILEK